MRRHVKALLVYCGTKPSRDHSVVQYVDCMWQVVYSAGRSLLLAQNTPEQAA